MRRTVLMQEIGGFSHKHNPGDFQCYDKKINNGGSSHLFENDVGGLGDNIEIERLKSNLGVLQ